MEFNEKLQNLRKQKCVTQEELAKALFVSRTAVSKWESGRGYPNIDSLKAIAKFFDISLDELLSSDQLITIAQEDVKRKEMLFKDLLFGFLDLSFAMLLFLPFFGQKINGTVQGVSLLALNGVTPYLKTLFFIIVICIVTLGILTLALQNCDKLFWMKSKGKISFGLNLICAALFIISLHPYAAIFSLFILAIKVILKVSRV